MRIKERVLYDPRVRGYEIVFSIIGAVKIPVLAYFFVVTNWWNLVFYGVTFLWMIGVVLDYYIGRVIAKKVALFMQEQCEDDDNVCFGCYLY